MSPSKPATVGALINVYILQVHIHTNNAPDRKKGGKEERKRQREGES